MKRIFDGVVDFWKRPAPADLAKLDFSERKRRCLPDSVRKELERLGRDPASFDWLLTVTELEFFGTLSNSTKSVEGFLAASGPTLLAFGYLEGKFQVEQGVLAASRWELIPDRHQPQLSIELPFQHFRKARVLLDSSCDYAVGPWWDALKSVSRNQTFGEGAMLGLARVSMQEVQHGGFGLAPANERAVGVCWISEGFFNVWPDGWSFSLKKVVAWNRTSDHGLQLCVFDSQQITLVEIDQITCGAEPALVRTLTNLLIDPLPPRLNLRDDLAHSGLFAARKVGCDVEELIWLCKSGGKLKRSPFGNDDNQTFALGYSLGDRVIISHLAGDAFAIRCDPSVVAAICELLPAFTELRGSAVGPWGVFLSSAESSQMQIPVLVRVMDHGLRIGSSAEIPWQQLTIEDGLPATNGCSTAQLLRRDDQTWQCELIGPVSLVTSLRGEVEMRQVTYAVSKENPGALYKRWASLRRDSFLFLLLGDVAALLEELDHGTDLAEAAQLLSHAEPQKLTADQRKALESAIGQLTLLAATLPQIKQHLELISLEVPYAWAQHEQAWLEALFGKKCAMLAGEKEAARGRELLSRSIRSMVAPMQRSLAELEAALRPTESLLFRHEIQRHPAMKMRQWGPAAVTAVISGASAGAMIASGGSAILLAPILVPALNQLLATEMDKLLREREKTLTLKRAVELAAGWIDLLRRGAEVSAAESRRFIERENIRAARRDRLLFEQCPAQLRDSVLGNLRKEIQRRSVDAKRMTFAKLEPGSDKRLGTTLNYIAQLSGRRATIPAPIDLDSSEPHS